MSRESSVAPSHQLCFLKGNFMLCQHKGLSCSIISHQASERCKALLTDVYGSMLLCFGQIQILYIGGIIHEVSCERALGEMQFRDTWSSSSSKLKDIGTVNCGWHMAEARRAPWKTCCHCQVTCNWSHFHSPGWHRQPGKVGNLDSLLYFKYFTFLGIVNFQVLDPLKQVLGVSNELWRGCQIHIISCRVWNTKTSQGYYEGCSEELTISHTDQCSKLATILWVTESWAGN